MGGFLAYQHTRIFGASAPGGGNPIHKTLMNGTTSITTRRPGAALRITFSFPADTTLKHRMVQGATTKDALLKEGAVFTGGAEYSFEIPTLGSGRAVAGGAEAAVTHDFVMGTDGNVDLFLVEEILEAVS